MKGKGKAMKREDWQRDYSAPRFKKRSNERDPKTTKGWGKGRKVIFKGANT